MSTASRRLRQRAAGYRRRANRSDLTLKQVERMIAAAERLTREADRLDEWHNQRKGNR